MQEFSAISVSTYSADGLAEKLTEASRDGWEVVSILNAGSNITAYLARPASDTVSSTPAPDEPSTTGNGWEATPIEAIADEPVEVVSAPAIDEPPVVTPPVIEEPVVEQPAAAWAPEQPVIDTPADDLSGLENQFQPQPEPQPSLADDIAALVPQIGDEPSADDATTEAPSPFAPSLPGDQPAESVPASQPEPTPTPEPEPAAAATTTATASAPQGWYDDPSGRFQYRYWDGGQWTEHVSRDGQQYTDPPVA